VTRIAANAAEAARALTNFPLITADRLVLDPKIPNTTAKPNVKIQSPTTAGVSRTVLTDSVPRGETLPLRLEFAVLTRSAFAAGAWIVSAVEPGPLLVFTICGLKPQLAPAGRPAQANVTADLNPFSGVTVNVRLPVAPGATVRDESLIDSE
jgi:hypothetical protein